MLLHANYRQSDPRWGSKPLGTTGRTLASAGCLFTSIANAMPAWALDKAEQDGDLTPGELHAQMKALGAVAASGDLDTRAVPSAFPQLCFIERNSTVNDPQKNFSRVNVDAALARIRRLVALGQPVVLNVDWSRDGDPDHFVTLVDADSWTIVDPLDGKEYSLAAKYGPPEKSIFGWLAYVGPPVTPQLANLRIGVAAWKLAQHIARPASCPSYEREALESILSGSN